MYQALLTSTKRSLGYLKRRLSSRPDTARPDHPQTPFFEVDLELDGMLSARAFLASGLAATTVLAAVAPVARAIDLVIVDPRVKEYMDSRDDAMRMKCEGGMMDCDGDRREYAKQATENFIRRNSGDVFEPPPCTVAEACTTDILGAAMAGLNGLTTSEKLEKMGKNGDAVNATRPYFGDAVGNEAEAR